MERTSFAAMHCSIAQCLEVVGEWWSMLILRDAFFGVSRFDTFQDRLGISRNVLNQRLTRLVESGVLVKVPYSQHPPRYDYRLTDKGRDLWPVLTSMRQWGDKYAAPDGPPVLMRHSSCGQISTAVMTCSACGEPLDSGGLRAVAGPGDLDGLAIAGGHPGRRPPSVEGTRRGPADNQPTRQLPARRAGRLAGQRRSLTGSARNCDRAG